jgi:putative hydrolase of the HAD superfamily
MRRALLVDLFSTLVPGGDAERGMIHQEMSAVLGVDAQAFSREFAATAYERFTGAYGDLPSTLRVIARRTGVHPTDEQVREATILRRGLSRRLLNAAPALGMHAIRTTEHSNSDPTWTGPTVASFTELPALIGAPAAAQ